MRYRIKIVTYKDGQVKYFAQYYIGFFLGWGGIGCNGDSYPLVTTINDCTTRSEALNCIDKNIKGAGKEETIEFEYINK